MGKEDIQTSDYFENNVLFADIANGFLFDGRQVIDPKKLEEANKELLFTETKRGNKATRDNVKKYYGKTLLCIYVLENQQNIDYHMVLRNMLAEALEYDRQWKEKKKLHKEQKDLEGSHEMISGMKKKERFVPVVTMVVYYGQDKWDAATCLHELLEFGDLDASLRQYVENYHIHVFDYHDYENFAMFKTELNQVFSFLKCSDDKEKLKKLIANRQEEYYNMSNESVELLATITKSKELLKLERSGDNKGGNDMCKALEDIKLEGVEEGKLELLKSMIQKKLTKGKSVSEIAEALETDESTIEALIKEISK